MLLILSFLYLILFTGKISHHELITLVSGNFFTAIYFIGNVSEFMGLSISMLTAHKMADAGLWLGFLFFIHLLCLEHLLTSWMNMVYKIFIFIALLIILSAEGGDAVQLGTTIPFLPTLIFISYATVKLLRKRLISRKSGFQFIGMFCILIAYSNDVLVVTGILQSIPIFPVSVVGSYVFILLSINERITQTYNERDQLKLLTTELQQQAYANLQKAQNELIEAEKMAVMGRAVARIAHELNTPIYLVRSAAQGLQKQTEKLLHDLQDRQSIPVVEKVKHYQADAKILLHALMTSVARAAELVRNFKEISIDQINVQKKEFQLLDYIQSCLSTLNGSLERKGIQVRVAGDAIKLYSDPGLFFQIIQNLVANAERYAYDTGGIIDIQVTPRSDEIDLVFRDYGKGIPAANLPHIFDAFFTTGGGSGGTGLGLNIVYRIVTQQLKGHIRCESSPGAGTTFFITIPKGA